MLFAIGAGPQVVGVSSYDHFPPEVETLPKSRRAHRSRHRANLSLRPDLVVVYGSQTGSRRRFEKAGIPTFNYRHGGRHPGTLDTITALGAVTGHDAQAREVVARHRARLEAVRTRVAGRERPRTLLVWAASRARCRASTPAGAPASCTRCSTWPAATTSSTTSSGSRSSRPAKPCWRGAPDVLLELRARAPAGDYPAGDLAVWDTLASVPAVRNRAGVFGGRRLRGGRRAHGSPRAPKRMARRAAPRGVQMKILLSWSSGKDSAWALHVLRQTHPGAVAGLLTTINESVQRVAMHAVRRDVLEAQAHAAGLPLRIVPIPDPCSNEEYEVRMRRCVDEGGGEGFTHVAFGDLFLEDVRRYREDPSRRTPA